MVIRGRSFFTRPNTPLKMWLLAGATFLALTGLVVAVSPRIVEADMQLLPRPIATSAPSLPGIRETAPDSLTPKRTLAAQRAALLRGFASWYGQVFHGHSTASGEAFDMNALTACHKTLPFGSLVRVVNLRNRRSVVVRITDRSDLPKGRVIDLSYAAAKSLAMTESGLAPVALEVISRGRP